MEDFQHNLQTDWISLHEDWIYPMGDTFDLHPQCVNGDVEMIEQTI
jgi:hypothetical protein